MLTIFLLIICAVIFVVATILSWRLFPLFMSGSEAWHTSPAGFVYKRVSASVSSGGVIAVILGVFLFAVFNPKKTGFPSQETTIQVPVSPSAAAVSDSPIATPQAAPEAATVSEAETKVSEESKASQPKTSQVLEATSSPEKAKPVNKTEKVRTTQNCENQETFLEKRICQDDALSTLNDELDIAIKEAINRAGGSSAVQVEQQRWFQAMLINCFDENCVSKEIRDRTAELNQRYRGK